MPCHHPFVFAAGACSTFGILHAMKLLPKVGRVSRRGHLYLRRDVAESPFGPLPEPPLFCVSLLKYLQGSQVHCEPKLIVLETCRLYSRLISCTRKISTLHLEFKCVPWQSDMLTPKKWASRRWVFLTGLLVWSAFWASSSGSTIRPCITHSHFSDPCFAWI